MRRDHPLARCVIWLPSCDLVCDLVLSSSASPNPATHIPPQTAPPMRHQPPPEFINTSDVISAVLTQVVAESAYDVLMRELLFSQKGQVRFSLL